MRTGFVVLSGALTIASPVASPAWAESPDQKYCEALADRFEETSPEKQSPSVEIDMATAGCKSPSKVAASIATLEKALRGKRITLPPRP